MRTSLIAAALLAVALFIGGYAIGQVRGVSGTFAAGSTATATPTTSSPAAPSFPAHGSAAHEDAEKLATGTAASKAQAAAVKYVGGGTAGQVTTDCQGSGYEVAVTKSDGSTVEVHLDSSFNVVEGHGGDGDGFGPPAAGASGAPSA